MDDRDYLLIVGPDYKDYDLSFNLHDVSYIARIDDPEADTEFFEASLAGGTVSEDWVLEPAGTLPIQVVKVSRKTVDTTVQN